MRRWVWLGLGLTVMVFAADEFRVWHDVKGRVVTAKLLACDGSTVTLQRQDGKQSKLPLAQLAPNDRAAATTQFARVTTVADTPATPAPSGALPATCSLRPEYKRLGLDVGDQGRRGSCLIFGVVNPLEFQLARRGKKTKLSERFMAWAANTVRGRTDGSEGYTVADVLRGIEQYGYTTERMFGAEYRDRGNVGRPDKDALADAAKNRNVRIEFFGPQGLDTAAMQAMCATIAASNPVTLCLLWPEKVSFGNRKLIKPWKKPAGGHALVAVGYVRDEDKPGGGMFEVRNSWGDNWGNDGYAFLSFELLQQNHECAFAIVPE
jgi:C1A family cysteine protease